MAAQPNHLANWQQIQEAPSLLESLTEDWLY